MRALAFAALLLSAPIQAQGPSLFDVEDEPPLLRSHNDRFSLTPTGFMQFRYTATTAGEGGDDYTGGFSIRRLRLTARGRAFDPSLTYKVTASFSRSTGEADLSDGYVEWAASERVSMQAGQFKLPLLREQLDSAKRPLLVDRSLTNNIFSQGRSQGVQLNFAAPRIRAHAAFTDGLDGDNTDLGDTDVDWALTGRVEGLLLGDSFAPFRDVTSPRSEPRALRLGGAVHAQDGELLQWTTDLTWQGGGWSLFAAAIGRHGEPPGEAGESFDDYGFVAGGGVYLSESLEAAVRYDVTLPDGGRPGGSAFQTLGVGLNWYLVGHALRISADVQVFLDDASDNDLVEEDTAVGLLPEGESGDIAFRVQMQMVF